MIGERTNVTGSRRFARLIPSDDYESALAVALDQVRGGANLIDVNMDEGMLDSEQAMTHVPQPRRDRARDRARADHGRQLEVVGDRGRPQVRAGQGDRQLDQPEGGRGGVPRARAARPALRRGGRRHGLRREGPGRPRSSARSRSASAPIASSPRRSGFPPEDIIFDPNILAIATGIEEHNDYAIAFIEATRLIKRTCPGREGERRGEQPLLLVPRQRRRARGDALGVPLPRDPRRAGHGDRQRRTARRLRGDPQGCCSSSSRT